MKSYKMLCICGLSIIFIFCSFLAFAGEPGVVSHANSSSSFPWWFWPLALFIFTFILGILAVLAGVGGGVLFVPLVSSFFPFHLDFVRGAGLFVALTASLSAGLCHWDVGSNYCSRWFYRCSLYDVYLRSASYL